MGYDFDFSTSKALADSLDKIKKLKDPFFNKLVRILTTRTMNEVLGKKKKIGRKMKKNHNLIRQTISAQQMQITQSFSIMGWPALYTRILHLL